MGNNIMKSDITNLISACDEQNIKIQLTQDEQLKISAPDGKIGKDLLGHIKVLKAELIEFLKEMKHKSSFEEIVPVESKPYYDVSPAQRRLWILSQFKENKSNFHIPAAFIFDGNYKKEVMQKTFSSLIERHEILRTTFTSIQGEPKQVVTASDKFHFEIDIQDIRKNKNAEQEAQHIARKEVSKPFDLAKGPLFRVKVIQLKDNKFILLFTMHHIISDGWSMKILLRDLRNLYAAFDHDQTPELNPLRIQYKDYTQWLNHQLSGERLERQRAFWHDQFKQKPVVLDLPTDYKRPRVLSNNGSTVKMLIDGATATELRVLSTKSGTSLFMTLLAAVNVLLHRYTCKEDICIGSPIAGRVHADLEEQVGFYLNNLVFRTQLSGKETFTDLLVKTKNVCLGAFEHQLYPFDQLIDELNLAHDRSRSPLFDVVLVLQNTDLNLDQKDMADVDVKGFDTGYRVSTSDLRIEFTELRHGLELSIDYNTDLFSEDRIQRMLSHFKQLFISVISDPQKTIDSLNYVSADELAFVHSISKGAKYLIGEDATLASLFEQQAEIHPDNRAVTFQGNILTYKELNEKANQLAHHLISFYGVVPGDIVGMMLDRSENLLVGILGIMKAGAAYLPLDPGEPEIRKLTILKDAAPKLLITESSHIFSIGDYACALFAMDSQLSTLSTSKQNLNIKIRPQSLAYVIYTSGSTGVPKGVMVEHRGAVNVALDHSRRFDLTSSDVTALFFPVTFDASVFKIFMTLLSGGGLVILSENIIFDPHECLDYLRATNTTICAFPPSYFNLFNPETLSFLKVAITGGEAPNYKHALACSEHTRMFNAYGPTECSVCAAIKEVGNDDRLRQIIPIGSPIDNVRVFLSDESKQLVPVGIPGELLIAGVGVARGYLNNPEVTHERFVDCPFAPGTRAYKTGDLGKWTSDGQIEFLGRVDRQVKIRGYRIELGEIENVIGAIPEVSDVTVKVIDDQDGDKQLAAYYTVREEVDEHSVKSICYQSLPAYMVPNFYIRLEAFSRNASGKIIVDALPAIDEMMLDNGKDYTAPTNDLEQKIVTVWEEQLGVEKIGITKNFFSAGGDSIKAIRVAGAINKLLGANIEVKEIFEFQDVASLARHIQEISGATQKDAEQILAAKVVEDVKNNILQNEYYRQLLPDTWEDIYPMSEIQKGMVFYTMMNPTSGVYHDQMYYQFQDESFDLEMFKRSIDILVERQSIFRTSFHLHGFSEGIQIVHRFESFKPDFEFVSLQEMSEQEKKTYLEEYLLKDRQRSFDFTKAGIWRIRIFQLAKHEYGFLLIGHHAIIDGWSDASFRTELSNVYFKLKEDPGYKPEFLKTSYKDYIIDQCYHRNSTHTQSFWKSYLEGYSRTELPLHRPNKVSHASRQQVSFLFSLSPDLTSAVFQFSENNEVSVKDLCLAALVYLLKITTNANDITLGLLTNGRPAKEDADKIFGCFLNTVPFRQTVDNDVTNRKFLKAVCENSKQSKSYDKLPLTSIMEVIGEKTGSSNPIFDVLFNFVNMHIISQVHDNARLSKPIVKGFGETNTLMDLVINCSQGYIQSYFSSYLDLYDRSELERFAQYYQRILKELISEDEKTINPETLLGNKELNLVKTEFNNTKTEYPTTTIQKLFELQVAVTPSAIALVEGENSITYAALNTQANRLANYLRANYSIKPDDRIGMLMNRSSEMIVGILGILKSGAAYVPIDPSYPKKRIAMILEQADVKMLLTQSSLITELAGYYEGELFAIDIQLDELETSDVNPEVNNSNDHLAYIMFTSGSSGLPKGVAVEHKSVVRLVKNTNYTELKPGDQVLQLSNYAFDGSVFDIFGALLNGGTLHIIDKDIVLSHHALAGYITAHHINITFITTSLFNNLVELGPECIGNLGKLYFGGEEASLTHIRKALQYRKHSDSIVHVYGPTESTTFSTYHIIDHVREGQWTVPIGKPISNTTLYILNENLQPVPVGTIGEICLGGDGLARGYWKNEKLTNEKFVPHPFAQGEKLYRTGDLGKMTSDGAVYFCGRRDTQIKLRGNRVELPEIENVILKQEGIRQAHVRLSATDDGEKMLVAYYVGKINDLNRFRARMEQILPDYMVPAHFVQLEAMPFNKNGKIDKSALPHPLESKDMRNQYTAPRTETERVLVSIWEKVLKRTNLGIDANFFELGGHSLKATQLVYYIAQELGVDVNLREIFATPTVKEIAAIIDQSEKSVHKNIITIEEQDFYEVSHAQKRLWIHQQYDEDTQVYIVPCLYRFKGRLNIKALEKAFRKLIQRHESLRTIFPTVEGKPKQRVMPAEAVDFKIAVKDCCHARGDNDVQRLVKAERESIAFNLESGPLLITRLLQIEAEEYVFMFFMHHIISDGWSMGVFLQEITLLYEHYNEGKAVTLPPLATQYKDYTAWHNEQLSGDVMNTHQQYWHNKLGGELPTLDLPVDFERPQYKTYEGALAAFTIDEKEGQDIMALAHKDQVSLFIFLEAVVKLLLYKYSGQKDIILGTPIAGREHADLENQIGFYLNTLALRTKLDSTKSFRDLIMQIKEETLQAFEHQLYPFDNLVDELGIDTTGNRSPLFDVMLVLQNMDLEREGGAMHDVNVSGFQETSSMMASKYDLTFFFKESGQTINGNIAYNTSLFTDATVAQIKADLLHIIQQVLKQPEIKLSDVMLVTHDHSKDERLNAFID